MVIQSIGSAGHAFQPAMRLPYRPTVDPEPASDFRLTHTGLPEMFGL